MPADPLPDNLSHWIGKRVTVRQLLGDRIMGVGTVTAISAPTDGVHEEPYLVIDITGWDIFMRYADEVTLADETAVPS